MSLWKEGVRSSMRLSAGRPSLTPGIYFRSLLLGYFEGIDSVLHGSVGWLPALPKLGQNNRSLNRNKLEHVLHGKSRAIQPG